MPKQRKTYQLKTTITLPIEWKPKIDAILEKKGYTIAEFIRQLIRIVVVEGKCEEKP